MLILTVGLAVFLAAHALPMAPQLRSKALALIGEGGYKIAVSLVSLLGVGLIIYGFAAYRASDWLQLWTPPRGMRHLTLTLMLPVFPLLFATYLPGWIKAKAKHPTLLAIKIWALAHLLANGDAGGMLLFLTFLVWGVIARVAAKRRAAISAAPAASFGRNDVIAIVAGLALYAAFVKFLHPWLIGVTILP